MIMVMVMMMMKIKKKKKHQFGMKLLYLNNAPPHYRLNESVWAVCQFSETLLQSTLSNKRLPWTTVEGRHRV